MKKLFVSQSLVEVESLKDILDKTGIPCAIKNQQGSSLAGAVPFVEVFPELWVLNDADLDRAKEFLEGQGSNKEADSPAWRCTGCGEQHVGQFTVCWKCGKERNSSSDSLESPAKDETTQGQEPLLSDFVKGLALGVVVVLLASTIRHYMLIQSDDADRNGDGKADIVYIYDGSKVVAEKYDNDFDGFFETHFTFDRNGQTLKGTIDRFRTGKPDIIQYYTHGKVDTVEYYDTETGKLRKRVTYKFDVKVREEMDQDGDGVLEKIVKFDKYEDPLP